MQEDIAELAKRVLELDAKRKDLSVGDYNALTVWQHAKENYERVALKEAPKLAQAVLDYHSKLDKAVTYKDIYQEHFEAAKDMIALKEMKIVQLEEEIAALRPDALAWRERERAYQEQIAELKGRMIAPGEKGGEG